MKYVFMLLCITLASLAQAQTRYVSDELRINLRSGEGDQYRITKFLRSGTRMEILEAGSTEDWAKVRIASGEEGWVRTQYLQAEPIARDLLAQARKKIAELTALQNNLNSSSSELQQQNATLSAQLQESQELAAKLARELDELKRISANAVQLNNANKQLMEQRQILDTEIDVLKAENERLSDNSNQTWFLYGAIAVIIGVLLTLILQKIRMRRSYSEWA
ncbi:TIGR04211 family SH3 domain-containing protein [Aurantivibrio plasticivorans]